MAKSHAILSPSGASRWLACTPSARVEEQFPDSTSSYADEGTYAHAVGELILEDPADFKQQLDKLKNSKLGKLYHSDALYGYADEYAEFVRRNCTGDHMLFIEQKLDVTEWVPEGFGTGDAIVIKDDEMFFDDLKYGQGVEVSAVKNPQLMIYALGALSEFGWMYDIKWVTVSIFQPRIGNISSYRLSVEELLQWAETELKPKAKLAWEGKGEFVPGEHCKFCKVGAECRALADFNLKIAEHEFFGEDPEGLLSLTEIAGLLEKAETIQLWIKLLQGHAFDKALAGERVPGYKLVEGRSNRKYSDEAAVITTLKQAGFKEEEFHTKPALLGITAMQTAIKKKAFTELVEPLLVKPPGAPTLVKDTDPRPEFNSAELDFKDLTT